MTDKQRVLQLAVNRWPLLVWRPTEYNLLPKENVRKKLNGSTLLWNKLAELCNKFLGKGRLVYVEGRLRTRSWDGQDGQKHYRTELIAEQVTFLDKSGQPLDNAAQPMSESGQPGEKSDATEPDDISF